MRTARAAFWLGAVALSQPSFFACSPASARGSPDAGGGGGAPVADPFGASACSACVLTVCAPSISVCTADPECTRWLACLMGCPVGPAGDVDPACVSGCMAPESSAGAAASSALETCRTSGLGTQCSACFTTETPSDLVLHQTCAAAVVTPSVCDECLGEQCCNTQEACQDDADCTALDACIEACAGEPASCTPACYAAHPGGLQKLAPEDSCRVALCYDACVELPDGCTTCILSNCRVPYVDLAGSPEGAALLACQQACAAGDGACDDLCQAAHPTAMASYQAYVACLAQCPVCGS